ncbi:hypothetical protein ACOMHN_051961 [Nucella lapillus]
MAADTDSVNSRYVCHQQETGLSAISRKQACLPSAGNRPVCHQQETGLSAISRKQACLPCPQLSAQPVPHFLFPPPALCGRTGVFQGCLPAVLSLGASPFPPHSACLPRPQSVWATG